MPRAKANTKSPKAKLGRKPGRRGGRRIEVTLSNNTVRANDRLQKALAKLDEVRAGLRARVGEARALAGAGRGKRPTSPKAAARAKSIVAKAQTLFATARTAARDARKAHQLSYLQDKQQSQLGAIKQKAVAANAAGVAKVEAKIERAVAKLRGALEKRLLKVEARRAKRRLASADRRTRATQRRLDRQLAKASGQKVARKKRARKA